MNRKLFEVIDGFEPCSAFAVSERERLRLERLGDFTDKNRRIQEVANNTTKHLMAQLEGQMQGIQRAVGLTPLNEMIEISQQLKNILPKIELPKAPFPLIEAPNSTSEFFRQIQEERSTEFLAAEAQIKATELLTDLCESSNITRETLNALLAYNIKQAEIAADQETKRQLAEELRHNQQMRWNRAATILAAVSAVFAAITSIQWIL